jgi:hypothetical protein
MKFADSYDAIIYDGKVLWAVPDSGVEAEAVGSFPSRLGCRRVPINLPDF